MTFDNRLSYSLFSLRIGVFIVMFMWTMDKFINPAHTAKVFEKFYMIDGLSENAAFIVGVVQLAILVAFITGFKKRISYGLVLAMHFVSTVSSYGAYLHPWTGPNLLFFAAFPMLAATLALYLLREKDTFMSV